MARKVTIFLWVIREIVALLAKDFPNGKTIEICIKTGSNLGRPLNQDSVSNMVKLTMKGQKDPQ